VLCGRSPTLTSWGEPNRPDLTTSIAKTYLAVLGGVAHDRRLLPDVDEPLRGVGAVEEWVFRTGYRLKNTEAVTRSGTQNYFIRPSDFSVGRGAKVAWCKAR
jgi:hypothetical protein